MTDESSAARQGADAGSEPDASGPQPCDWDIGDGDNLQAVWLEFQREMAAACPVTGTAFDLALGDHPAEDDSSVAEVLVACERCGRRVSFAPPDAREIFGWAE